MTATGPGSAGPVPRLSFRSRSPLPFPLPSPFLLPLLLPPPRPACPRLRPLSGTRTRTHTQTRTPPRPKPTTTGPPGFITIDSAPVYATIAIDGRGFGETPLIHVELAPGRHAVHAVSPSGATHDLSITIESGKVAPAARIEW